MKRAFLRPLAALCLLTLTSPTYAERAPLSPEKLEREATHIVEGEVQGVYTRDVASDLYGPGTVVTQFLIEIEVRTCAKGDRIQPNDVIYGRCWKVKRRGVKGLLPGPGGHFQIPEEGDHVRAFLKKGRYLGVAPDNNGLNVVYPNGIDYLPEKAAAQGDSSEK